MKKLIYRLTVILMVGFGFMSCSHKDESNQEAENATIDFGSGTYRPTPFHLDDVIPFSWLGMPDSVKKEAEIVISFNEDAIRSQSKSNIYLVDSNGNRVNGIHIGSLQGEEVAISAGKKEITLPLTCLVNPEVGDSLLKGYVMVVGDKLDEVNNTQLIASATPIGDWQLKHKTGINWWRWLLLILVVVLILAVLFLIGYGIWEVCKAIAGNIPTFTMPKFMMPKFNRNKKKKEKKRRDDDIDDGKKHGRPIDQYTYKLDRKFIIPNGSQYKNPLGKTNGQLMKELNDNDGIIKLNNGEPVFNKDGGTKSGKPLEAKFPNGIDEYLNKENLRSGKKVDRQHLHNEAFKRIAEKYGMSPDELQIFKGNSEPLERLKKRWGCSEQEVFRRCRNPYRIARVLHECRDGKTVQLVPWLYHHISHSGGIEAMRGS